MEGSRGRVTDEEPYITIRSFLSQTVFEPLLSILLEIASQTERGILGIGQPRSAHCFFETEALLRTLLFQRFTSDSKTWQQAFTSDKSSPEKRIFKNSGNFGVLVRRKKNPAIKSIGRCINTRKSNFTTEMCLLCAILKNADLSCGHKALMTSTRFKGEKERKLQLWSQWPDRWSGPSGYLKKSCFMLLHHFLCKV